MRRRRFQSGGLSKRKRNGRLYWYLQWREGGQPKSKELGLVSDITRAQAEILRAAIMEPINKGVAQTAKPAYTFEQFIEAVYLPVALRRWKVSTAMTNEVLMRAHLLPALGPRLVTDIRREDLQAFLDRVAFSGRSRSIVDHLRWQLRSIFRLAMGDGLITVDPTLGLSTPRSAKAAGEKRVMSGSDVQRAMKVLPIRERLIFRLATIEGMRPGEILGLQLQDMAEQSVKVARRVYEGDVDVPKTGRARVVGLSLFGDN